MNLIMGSLSIKFFQLWFIYIHLPIDCPKIPPKCLNNSITNLISGTLSYIKLGIFLRTSQDTKSKVDISFHEMAQKQKLKSYLQKFTKQSIEKLFFHWLWQHFEHGLGNISLRGIRNNFSGKNNLFLSWEIKLSCQFVVRRTFGCQSFIFNIFVTTK